MGDSAFHDLGDGVGERHSDASDQLGAFGARVDFGESFRQIELGGRNDDGREWVDGSEIGPSFGLEAEFFFQFPLGGAEGGLSGLDAATNAFDGVASDTVMEFVRQIDEALVIESDDTDARFHVDDAVGPVFPVRSDDVVSLNVDPRVAVDPFGGDDFPGAV